MENLLPLQKLILALYRNGTAQDCFYYVDDTFSDKYLLKALTLRIIDMMLYEARKKTIKKYFLTWRARDCQDMDEWIAIAYTHEDLKKLYEEELEEYGAYNREKGLELKAYEYIEPYAFTSINIL